MPRWCQACRATRQDEAARKRLAVRRCYKCQIPLPNAARKPGKAVCEDCRVDKRVRGSAHEQRRRLRKYGITQADYDEMFAKQGECCGVCRTFEPGPKGWQIDHNHRTGRFRALLCHPCNTALGLVAESPATLKAMVAFLEEQAEIDKQIKI